MSLVTSRTGLTFDVGDRPTLVATFRNKTGDLNTPSSVMFSLMAPNGDIESRDETFATNPSTGVWEWEIPSPFDVPGTWRFRALATAGLQVAEEIEVVVRKSKFPYPPGS